MTLLGPPYVLTLQSACKAYAIFAPEREPCTTKILREFASKDLVRDIVESNGITDAIGSEYFAALYSLLSHIEQPVGDLIF